MNPEIRLKQLDQRQQGNCIESKNSSTLFISTTYANNLLTENTIFIEFLTKKVSQNVLNRSKTKKIDLKLQTS